MTAQMDRSAYELHEAVVSKHRIEVATLDYRRAIKHLATRGRTQTEVAKALRISQPSLNSALKAAKRTPDPAEGFSGAGPYEICQRYAVEQIDRAQLIDELARWAYTPIPQPDWLEDVIPGPGPGSWHEVLDAVEDGLIDDDIYAEVQKRRFPHSA